MPAKLLLIDGNSLLYRAFFALPDSMKTSDGQVTNAVYGFTTMLLKVLEDPPDLIAISFDLKAPTFRHLEYEDYKANRASAPDILISQIELVRDVVKAFDIPIYEKAGFEADDVIGTLAYRAAKEGLQAFILTGDMDAAQLVSPKIKLLSTVKGISKIDLYDEEKVFERYGIKASQVVDLKALKGDSSDNIPGVFGIGEKTAVKLLQEYETLDGIYENLTKIKPAGVQKKLSEHQKMAYLSQKLARIVTNVPLAVDFKACRFKGVNWPKVLALFERLQFSRLLKKYGQQGLPLENHEVLEKKREKLNQLELHYETVETVEKLKELVEGLRSSGGFAVDTETTSVDPMQAELVGLSFSWRENEAYYIPLTHQAGVQLPLDEVLSLLKPILEDEDIPKYGQNIKYDIKVLERVGIRLANIFFDTMLAAYLIKPEGERYNLKAQALKYLGREPIDFSDLIHDEKKFKNFSDVPIDIATEYSASDADVTYQLVKIFEKRLAEDELSELFHNLEMPLLRVLSEMEMVGVPIDVGALQKMGKEMGERLVLLQKEIFKIAGEEFNLNSPKQLSGILFGKLKLPIVKKTKTGPSTDMSVLEKLANSHEIANLLLEYRQISKLKSTYIDALPELIHPETGRIHTSFNQTITATGRLSSSKPNLQNIPVKGEMGKKIRETFSPNNKKNLILAADYSQIELRVLAHLSQDPGLKKAFLNDEDIHTATAAEVFQVKPEEVDKEMRTNAKAVNFGIIYGLSEYGLSRNLGIKREEAREFIDRYFARYLKIKDFISDTIALAREKGYVTTMRGRRRYLSSIESPRESERWAAERVAINTVIQGSAADVIKIAMININRRLKEEKFLSQMMLQVHDELVFEVPQGEAERLKKLVNQEMSEAVSLTIPLKVDIGIGASWGEAK